MGIIHGNGQKDTLRNILTVLTVILTLQGNTGGNPTFLIRI